MNVVFPVPVPPTTRMFLRSATAATSKLLCGGGDAARFLVLTEREDAAGLLSKGKARAFDHGRSEALDPSPEERELALKDGLVFCDHRIKERGHRAECRLELHGARPEPAIGEPLGGPVDEDGAIGIDHDFADVGLAH